MARLLEKAEELRVTTNVEGMPLTITRNGKPERVTRIYRQWHVSGKSDDQPDGKRYFKVRTSRGLVYDISRDTTSKRWYLDGILD